VWSAQAGTGFLFAKFVPPTVAAGKVFLATFSNGVRVYGPTKNPDRFNPNAAIAAYLQDPDNHQVTAAVIEPSGKIAVFGESNDGPWGLITEIGAQGEYPSGGGIVIDVQNTGISNQLVLLAVNNKGALRASILGLYSDPHGPWTTSSIVAEGTFPPGAKIATAHQTDEHLDAFLVGNDGHLHSVTVQDAESWVHGVLADPNSGDEPVFAHGNCVTGGCVGLTASYEGNGAPYPQLDVMAVDEAGVFWVYATSATEPGTPTWTRRDAFSSQHFLPSTADLAAARPQWLASYDDDLIDNQLDVFAVDNDGNLDLLSVDDSGTWVRTVMTGKGFVVTGAPPGARVAVSSDNVNQLEVAVVGNDGTIQIYSASDQDTWSGELLPTLGIAAPGAPIVLVAQDPDGITVNALVPRVNGIFGTSQEGNTVWLAPFKAL